VQPVDPQPPGRLLGRLPGPHPQAPNSKLVDSRQEGNRWAGRAASSSVLRISSPWAAR
jgi:hypothetical protein